MNADGRTLETEHTCDGMRVCRQCCPECFAPCDSEEPVMQAALTLAEEEARNWIVYGEQNPFGCEVLHDSNST